MTKMGNGHPTRRAALKLGAAAAASLPLSGTLIGRVRAQAPRQVNFTLPWIPNGSSYWPLIGKQIGVFAKHNLDMSVARGYGSVAAAQAVASGQFDFGMVFAGGNFLAAARKLPIAVLATVYYDAIMGIALRSDSPIKTPKDLEGKKLGTVPTSAESPFWPAFAKSAGIDRSKVTMVQVESKVIERALLDKQVDAITAVGTSSIPLIAAMGEAPRFMPWSRYGVELYAGQIVTRPEIVEKDPELCQKVVDAILECYAHTLREPESSLELFGKALPEVGLTKAGMQSARIAQGLTQLMTLRPEAMDNALGWSDMNKLPAMIDMVMEFGAPRDAVRPDAKTLVSNRFVGNVKLTPAEWAKVKQNTTEFAAYFGG
jgi:ABC-type nitrate/sulfonate/bicarbonate transport system substrate-binding protein